MMIVFGLEHNPIEKGAIIDGLKIINGINGYFHLIFVGFDEVLKQPWTIFPIMINFHGDVAYVREQAILFDDVPIHI